MVVLDDLWHVWTIQWQKWTKTWQKVDDGVAVIIKQLIEKFDEKFLRKYGWRYHILIVDNHFLDEYLFFLQSYKHGTKLHYSDDLLEMPHNPALYGQVLKDLEAHTNLSIEYRDTHHLVHPGTDITFDASHGHAFSTSYHPE